MLHVHLVVRVDVVGVGLVVTRIQSRDVVNHMTTGIQSRDVDKKTWESYVNIFLLKGREHIVMEGEYVLYFSPLAYMIDSLALISAVLDSCVKFYVNIPLPLFCC